MDGFMRFFGMEHSILENSCTKRRQTPFRPTCSLFEGFLEDGPLGCAHLAFAFLASRESTPHSLDLELGLSESGATPKRWTTLTQSMC